MTRRAWTAAEQRDAVRWYGSGMAVAVMAHALDRTPAAIWDKMRILGAVRRLPTYPATPEDVAAAARSLAAECAAARAERGTAAPYKRGELRW